MKGLIVKDIELTKNQGKTLLILAVVIAVFLEISGMAVILQRHILRSYFRFLRQQRFPMMNMKTGLRFFFPCR